MTIIVEYSANNSGGSWWLSDDNWRALEAAGWLVQWATQSRKYTDDGREYVNGEDGMPILVPLGESQSKLGSLGVRDGRYLGALAKYAWKKFESPGEAMREFERVTGQDVCDEGCNCCGAPHSFSWDGEDDGYASGSMCISYLYAKVPASLRDAARQLSGDDE